MNLKDYYNTVVKLDLISKFNYTNNLQIPKISRIIVHSTLKDSAKDQKTVFPCLLGLELITGQKAIPVSTKKANSSFKLQKGVKLGGKCTLQGEDMYIFLQKLLTIVLPKIKTFSGLSKKSFDSLGNYSFGIHSISNFPEIESIYDKFYTNIGLDITIITTASTDLEALFLLSSFQLPFKK